jgi:glycosyltransferase involved in cell wall biosynthesis
MRIAFVTDSYTDPRKPNSWSGLPHFMRLALEQAGVEVETVALADPNPVAGMARYAYWRFLRGRRYLRICEPKLLQQYAAETRRRLQALQVDAVFSPSSGPIAYLKADVPVVFWTDACFAGMLNFYESFSNLAPRSVMAGHGAEYSALKLCSRAIYSSAWGATTAQESYAADASKFRVVPFGGNVKDKPSLAEVEAIVARRETAACNLVLIGVDWQRKGADIAVEAVRSLNERGFPSRLAIVGCTPPKGTTLPPYVEVFPFINKATEAGSRQFNEICRRSHFMIMPTRADCTPVAIIESNYFALPCLSTAVGGIPSIVSDEVNGHLFDLRARGMAYADYILGLMRDPARYRALAVGAAAFADRNFTWEVSGAKLAGILREVVAAHQTRRSASPIAMASGI